MKKDRTSSKRAELFEDMYRVIADKAIFPGFATSEKEGSLEQPHTCEFVDSITTYGAYQKPIQ